MWERAFGRASGVGSWPGTDVGEAARTVIGELTDPGIPYLSELPARGPGSDLIGRGAVFLVDTPVDLQPSGWRLVSRPGRDLERARAMLTQDLDVLAEVADGIDGPLKVQVAGPWTLAASLYLPRLERAVVDAGACRDIVGALAEGVARHVAHVTRLLPGAQLIVQLDEPSIAAVLEGGLPTASGFGRLRAVEEPIVVDGIREVLEAARSAGVVSTVVHCCAPNPPIGPLLRTGTDGIGLDLSLLRTAEWEALAPQIESGVRLWAGAVPTRRRAADAGSPRGGADPGGATASRGAAAIAEAIWVPWRRLGLAPGLLDGVVVTPACGLASATVPQARGLLARAVAGARELAARAQS